MSRTTTDLAAEDRDLARLAAAFSKAAAELVPGDDTPPNVAFESPRNASFGDFASNVALQLAKRALEGVSVEVTDLAFETVNIVT